MKWYFCSHCEVWGRSAACWCCEKIEHLIHEGAVVDEFVYDWDTNSTPQIVSFG